MLRNGSAEQSLGLAEKLAGRVNGVAPRLLDRAFTRHRKAMHDSVPVPLTVAEGASMIRFFRTYGAPLAFALALWASRAVGAPIDDAVADLAREWAAIKYQSPANEQAAKFEALAAQAKKVTAEFSGRAEPLVWEGIIVSSLAGAKGGIGALGLVKQAKALYEDALKIDANALDGSAYNSLGVLYYKVPGWPIGFGDKPKAQELLQKALAINPQGIDPNFFYGEYLIESGKPGEAVPYLERAVNAPRASRPRRRRHGPPRGGDRAVAQGARQPRNDQREGRRSVTRKPRAGGSSSDRSSNDMSRSCSAATRMTIEMPSPLPGLLLSRRPEEAIAQPLAHRRVESGSPIFDDDPVGPELDDDVGARWGIAQGVVDEVAQHQRQQMPRRRRSGARAPLAAIALRRRRRSARSAACSRRAPARRCDPNVRSP